MKKTGAGSKSADIRSFFKALSTSKAGPSKPKDEPTAESSTKKKTKLLVESDEDDFAKGSEDQRKQNGSASKSKSRSESSPKKEKDIDIKSNPKPEKSKRDSSREQSDDRSSSSKSKRKTDAEETPSKSKSSSSKSSPVKSVKESEEKAGKGSKKRTDDEITPAKGGKQSKGSSVDKVKKETTADSPSGRKKRSAKAMEDSDEEESFNPMPPPSKKKTKNVRHEVTVTPARKTPTTSEIKTPVATPEEKKKQHAAGYFKFLSRPPPKSLGAKEIPEGAPDCLANLTFVTTGVLPSFERDDIADAIKKYGGRVTGSVSKKTSYVIVGDEPGASKTKKAEELGVPMISEDDILDMIRKSNPNPPSSGGDQMEIDDETDSAVDSLLSKADMSVFEKSTVEEPTSSKRSQATPKRKHADVQEFDSDLETPPKVRAQRSHAGSRTPSRRDSPSKSKDVEPQARKSLNFAATQSLVTKESEASGSDKKTRSPTKPQVSTQAVTKAQIVASVKPTTPPAEPPLLWVDKYKPTSLKQIVGQGGDASNAKKLLKWLQNWFNYHGSADDKAKSNWPGLRDPEGKTFKAALLSGPPGVGKTTTAHLVCKELGYDFIELNASDQRNKNGLKLGFSDSLSNMSISAAAHGGKANQEKARRHVLIMDEVDGMSGNEDRGGIQELIGLIKTSRVPIICICNDRQHPKIRSLANYCFDLRFTKPRYEQLKSFVQSICFKEKLKIPPEMLQQLIISTDQDVRQILNQLQLFKEAKEKSSYDPRKDLHLGPWEVIRKVFSAQDHKNMSINDKQSLFFHDYSLGPLFVQENYLRSVPNAANGDPYKTMDLVRAAAESLATGDRVEKIIRSNNAWSLLPVQALFSSVFPGEYMEGNGLSSIEFPQWLGKNSNRNKRARLLQELHTHMHLKISGSLEALNMDYLPYLRRAIVNPLVKGDAETAAEVMHDYCLLREDMEALTELAVWPNMKDLFERVDSKTKAAFTRLVNKEAFVPYSIVKITKGKGKAVSAEEELEGLEGDEAEAKAEEEEEEEDLEKDAMIKVKKPRGAKGGAKAGTSKSASQKSKGKRVTDIDLESDEEELDVKPKGRGKKGGAPSKSRKK